MRDLRVALQAVKLDFLALPQVTSTCALSAGRSERPVSSNSGGGRLPPTAAQNQNDDTPKKAAGLGAIGPQGPRRRWRGLRHAFEHFACRYTRPPRKTRTDASWLVLRPLVNLIAQRRPRSWALLATRRGRTCWGWTGGRQVSEVVLVVVGSSPCWPTPAHGPWGGEPCRRTIRPGLRRAEISRTSVELLLCRSRLACLWMLIAAAAKYGAGAAVICGPPRPTPRTLRRLSGGRGR